MDDQLGSINKDQCPFFVCLGNDAIQIRTFACHIGHSGDRQHFRVLVHLPKHRFTLQGTVFLHFGDAQLRVGPSAQLFPGKIVGRVLQLGNHHVVFRSNLSFDSPSHQIDGLGAAFCVGNFLRASRINPLTHTLLGLLVRLGCLQAQGVISPMNVGIFQTIELFQSTDDRFRFLGRRGVVKINQTFVVAKDGKKRPNALFTHVDSPTGSERRTALHKSSMDAICTASSSVQCSPSSRSMKKVSNVFFCNTRLL